VQKEAAERENAEKKKRKRENTSPLTLNSMLKLIFWLMVVRRSERIGTQGKKSRTDFTKGTALFIPILTEYSILNDCTFEAACPSNFRCTSQGTW
jgi:hypothetical protein